MHPASQDYLIICGIGIIKYAYLKLAGNIILEFLVLMAISLAVSAQDSLEVEFLHDNVPVSDRKIEVGDLLLSTDDLGIARIPVNYKSAVVSVSGFLKSTIELNPSGEARVRLTKDLNHLDPLNPIGLEIRNVENQIRGAYNLLDVVNLLPSPLYANPDDGQIGARFRSVSRGIQSIYANINPIVVLDGIPLINEDITINSESFDVYSHINLFDLEFIGWEKNISTLSQYGSLGATGILHLKTKMPGSDRLTIKYSSQVGRSDQSMKRSQRLWGFNAEEYVELFIQGFENRNEDISRIQDQLENQFPGAVQIEPGGSYTLQGIDTDWMESISRRGWLNQHQLALSGKFGKVNYRLSGGYQNEQGPIEYNQMNKAQGGLSWSYRSDDRLLIYHHASLSNVRQFGIRTGDRWDNPIYVGLQLPPLIPLRNEEGDWYSDHLVFFFRGANPAGILNGEDITRLDLFTLNNRLGLDYQLSPEWIVKARGGVLLQTFDETFYRNKVFGPGNALEGLASEATTKSQLYQGDISVTYQLINTSRRRASVIIGTDLFMRDNQQDFIQANGFSQDNYQNIESAENIQRQFQKEDKLSFVGQYASITYSTRSGMHATGHFRRDGSNLYGQQNKYEIYYGARLGWDLVKLNFLKRYPALSSFSTYVGYGKAGNGLLPAGYNTSIFRDDIYNSSAGLILDRPGNRLLGPEITTGFDAEVHIGFWQDRLQTQISWFNKETKDIITNQQISLTSGVPNRFENNAQLTTSGLEIGLNFVPLKTSDWHWSCSAVFSYLRRNHFKRIENPFIEKDKIWIKDGFASGYLLYPWAGVDGDNGGPLWNSEANPLEATGQFDQTAKQYLEKSSIPQYFGLITQFLQYKNFSLTAWFTFAQNHHVFDENGWIILSDGHFPVRNQTTFAQDKWTVENQNGSHPIFIWGNDSEGNTKYSTRYLYDASFIRLRKWMLVYEIGRPFLSRSPFNYAKVYVSGENNWTLTRDKSLYQDAASPIDGITSSPIPGRQTWNLGIQVGL